MPVFIYCLKDPTTGDVRYIGQTNNLKRRLRAHLSTSSKTHNHLGNWLRSLGGEKPVLAILHEVAENESWEEEERRYISCARALGVDLTNGTDGGEGASNPSLETRKKIGAAHKGVKHSPEARAKMSASRTGIKATQEHRNAVSASRKGMKFTPEHCAAISAGKKGAKLTPEHCAVMSAARKGVPRPPETRAAISAALTGVPLSPEHCAAMSAALTGVPWSKARRAAYEAKKLANLSAK